MSNMKRELIKLHMDMNLTHIVLARLAARLGRAEELDEHLELLKDDFVADYIASSVGQGDWPAEDGLHDEALTCIESFQKLLKSYSSR